MPIIALKNYRPGKLAHGVFALSAGMGLRAAAQAGLFLIIARVLGSNGYGAFSAVLALAGSWACFSGLGGQVILMRDVARDPKRFAASFGASLSILGLSLIPIGLFYLLSAFWLLPEISWTVVLLLGLSELLFLPAILIAACAYQGYERMGRSARILLAPVLARLLGALVLLVAAFQFKTRGNLALWAGLYAITSLIATLYVVLRVYCDLGRPAWPDWHVLRQHMRSGLPFAFMSGAQKLNLDADKFLLAALSTLETAGLYSAGYRFVDLAFLPLYSLLTAAAPRHFRAGARGTVNALRAIRPLVVPALGYALLVVVALTLTAPILPWLLGHGYQEAVAVVRWLAWLPLVSLPKLLLHQALATSDAQHQGMIGWLFGAVLNLGLNIWWIPLWGWQGAAAATYTAEVGMTLTLSIIVARRFRDGG